jgi:hypothetical protein
MVQALRAVQSCPALELPRLNQSGMLLMKARQLGRADKKRQPSVLQDLR